MKRLSPIRIPRVFRHGPSLLDSSPTKFLPPASSGTLFTTFFRHSQLCDPSCQLLCSAARPQHTSTPPLHSICIGPASAAIAGGFLQVVVSKAREHTVLVQAPCPFALPIQH